MKFLIDAVTSMQCENGVVCCGVNQEVGYDDPKWLKRVEDIISRQEALLGRYHPDTLSAISTLAQFQLQTGEANKAVKTYKETGDAFRALYGELHEFTLMEDCSRADALRKAGNFDDAVKLLEEVVLAYTKSVGPNNKNTVNAVKMLEESRAGDAADY